MLNTKLITDSTPPMVLPERLGSVAKVNIFLYRAPQLRINENLNPMDCWLEPEQRDTNGFTQYQHYTQQNVRFVYWLDRASFARNEPLWFQAVAHAFGIIPLVFTTFMTLGGGGRGPEDDTEVLRYLLDLLRAFPKGWGYFAIDENDQLMETNLDPSGLTKIPLPQGEKQNASL